MPEAINSLDMTLSTSPRPLLALARHNGDIELYDGSCGWTQRRIPTGGAVGRCIQVVQWLPPRDAKERMPRLLSAGLDGNLVEWDVERLRARRAIDLNGGGIWCMAKSPEGRLLAAGCEDGLVRLVDASKLQLTQTLLAVSDPSTGARVVSLAWSRMHPELLAAGTSHGEIIIWDLSAPSGGTVLHRLAVDRGTSSRGNDTVDAPPIVWTLQFAGPTLIAGDSLGKVVYWDPRMGIATGESALHQGDVLSIAVHPQGRSFFASGADGMTVEYSAQAKNPKHANQQWRVIQKRHNHTHDIRASVCVMLPASVSRLGERVVLFTGGVDANVSVFDPLISIKAVPEKISCFPQQPPVRIATVGRMLVAQTGPHIRVWCLGRPSDAVDTLAVSSPVHGPLVGLTVPGRLVLQINMPSDESIQAMEISRDGRFFCYTTRSAIRLYELLLTREDSTSDAALIEPIKEINLQKIKLDHSEYGSPQAVQFSPDSLAWVISFVDGENQTRLVRFDCHPNAPESLPGLSVVETWSVVVANESAVTTICWADACIALHDLQNQLHFLNPVDGNLVRPMLTLPTWAQAMRFVESETALTLVVVTADKSIHQILPLADDPEDELVSITDLPAMFKKHTEPVKGLCCVPGTESLPHLRFWSDSRLNTLDLDKPIPTAALEATLLPSDVKTRKRTYRFRNTPEGQQVRKIFQENLVLFAQPKDVSLMAVEYLGPHEVVVVERPWVDIVAALPKAQARKHYGGFN